MILIPCQQKDCKGLLKEYSKVKKEDIILLRCDVCNKEFVLRFEILNITKL